MSQAGNACRKGGIHAKNMSSRPHTMISAISGRKKRAVFLCGGSGDWRLCQNTMVVISTPL